MFEVLDSELKRLTVDLGKVSGRAVPEVRKVVKRGAQNIKQDWAKGWQGHRHAPALHRAVSYDIERGGLGAEIGPDKGRGSGALGNIYEFGTPRNAPMPAGGPALTKETPKFEQALADCLRQLLER